MVTYGGTGYILVFGVEFPVLEFLLILNVIMLFYVVINMFELRSLIKLRKDMELIIEEVKELLHKQPNPKTQETQ
jgi:hypothetical protein